MRNDGLFNQYVLIYAIFSFAVMKQFGYLDNQSYEGWITISILAVIGVLLMKPFESLAKKMRQMSRTIRNIVFLENIAILFIVFQYGHNLIIALVGLILVVVTIVIGSRIAG
ncbi:hypothetical protein [Paenibacillus terreus]|uniref:hypothetical protein n=1 Tax=Paenibacillus terreus TaxID=1387834 RepID=UPI0035CD0F42